MSGLIILGAVVTLMLNDLDSLIRYQILRTDRTTRSRSAERRFRVRMYALISVAAVLGLVALSPYRLAIVVGESMTPTLRPRQPVLVDRSCYKTRAPGIGEVVVFSLGASSYVKRVAAGPGDDLWLLLYPKPVNSIADSDVVFPEDLPKVRKILQACPGAGELHRYRMPKDQVFVVGDGGNLSTDSRHFGPVSLVLISGRVCAPDTSTWPHNWATTRVPRRSDAGK